MVKSGNTQLNPEAFKDYTFEQFEAEYKGKLAHDIKEVWKNICDYKNRHKITSEDLGGHKIMLDAVIQAIPEIAKEAYKQGKKDAKTPKPGKQSKKADG